VPAGQAWYWTGSWQKGERAVDQHVAARRVKVADNVDDFLVAMERVRQKKRKKKTT
jgi:hypothetical protein